MHLTNLFTMATASCLPPSPLRADLYNSPAIPTSLLLPNGSVGFWQPTVVTLISGSHDAILVDTLFTTEQGIALGDWLEDTLGSRTLKTIYITHGHGDHWFNLKYLLSRFPDVQVVATAECVKHMATQLDAEMKTFWLDTFPDQISEESFEILAKPLHANDSFELEGQELKAISVGHSDTDDTSFLHVPSMGLAVAGDIVYNDVHMWQVESASSEKRAQWVRSLDKLEEYRPSVVVGSHHRPGAVDGPWNIGASKEYVKTFGRLVVESSSAEELYGKMIEAYPNRIGLLVLWLGCQAQYA